MNISSKVLFFSSAFLVLTTGIACKLFREYDSTSIADGRLQEAFYQGNYSRADSLLKTTKVTEYLKKGKEFNGRNLLYLDMGFLSYMNANYLASSEYYLKAIKSDDNLKPITLAYELDPTQKILTHYYLALNYIAMDKTEDAMVEMRQIDILNSTQPHPLGHLFLGWFYEWNGDANNAFIAYRNAYQLYSKEGSKYSMALPLQLKEDIIRTAKQMNFTNEVTSFERDFNLKLSNIDTQSEGGYALVVVENGFVPELKPLVANLRWNRTNISSKGVLFGMDYNTWSVGGSVSKSDRRGDTLERYLNNISNFQLRTSTYYEKPAMLTATISNKAAKYTTQTIMNVSDYYLQQEQKNLQQKLDNQLVSQIVQNIQGRIKAEARSKKRYADYSNMTVYVNNNPTNWKQLPHTLSYARIPLHAGSNSLTIQADGYNRVITVDGKKNRNQLVTVRFPSNR